MDNINRVNVYKHESECIDFIYKERIMKLFLTSSIEGSYKENGRRIPCALTNANHFLDHLKEYWITNSKCLLISFDSDKEEMNNSFKTVFTEWASHIGGHLFTR